MAVQIRKLQMNNTDLEAYVKLNNRVYVDDVSTVREERHWLSTAPVKANWQHWVAMQDGKMVGSAANAKQVSTDRPGSYRVHVAVDPEVRRQGIGSQLYDHCIAQLNQHHADVLFLFSSTREHYEDGVRFLQKRDFQLKMREPLSQLHVESFDSTPFQPKAEQIHSHGFEIKTLAELQSQFTDWAERYYRLDTAAMADVPSTDPFVPPSFEQFARSHLKEPDFDPNSFWIAVKDQEWLGLTSLWLTSADPEKAYTGLTGVLQPARRMGVATALKLRALDFARAKKVKIVQTDNEENNPMFQINLALGFKAIPASLYYRKDCTQGS